MPGRRIPARPIRRHDRRCRADRSSATDSAGDRRGRSFFESLEFFLNHDSQWLQSVLNRTPYQLVLNALILMPINISRTCNIGPRNVLMALLEVGRKVA